jgi:hypothetical protein
MSRRFVKIGERERVVLGSLPRNTAIATTTTQAPARRLYLDGVEGPVQLPRDRRVDTELVDGVSLRAKGDAQVMYANVGSAEAPLFLVTPGVRREDGTYDEAGALPLLTLAAAKLVGKQVKKANQRKRERIAQEEQERLRLQPRTQRGFIDSIKALFGFGPSVSGFDGDGGADQGDELQLAGYDELGAILVDTDGRRVLV